MGCQTATIKHVLCAQSQSQRCYPLAPYVTFPKDGWSSGKGGLLLDTHILPDKLQRCSDDRSWFWWSDAQFLPFNDACLFTTTSVYQPRLYRHWLPVSSIPSGRVLMYDLLSSGQMQCSIFSRTSCSVFPNVNPHPLGKMVAYCGTGEVVVMSTSGDPVYSRSRDICNAVHVHCAIANNGVSFACLKRGMGTFFLESYSLDSIMFCDDSIRCHTVCPGFVPSNNEPNIVVCKFSPDSTLLAGSSNKGYLFVVKRYQLQKLSVVCPDMTSRQLSTAQAFDFCPCSPFQIITLGTSDRQILTVNIDTGQVVVSTETEQNIDCVTFTPDGLFLAVGFHNFDIDIYDSFSLVCVHNIQMSALCQDQLPRVQALAPTVLHLSFTQNGEHLASTSCDGHLRLWRIRRMFSLQEICRDKILTCIAIHRIEELTNVPQKVKHFLQYKYF
ncbi:unnamed protein product [Candidula unifasciata]|uniref:SOCS box domain-containing protein n=1 Tax=Candidula unifasciata TaxID=100452 RepID=A0A8S3YCK2_9EUPU|nr:unnamed protein product [Candidula unifasciata]